MNTLGIIAITLCICLGIVILCLANTVEGLREWCVDGIKKLDNEVKLTESVQLGQKENIDILVNKFDILRKDVEDIAKAFKEHTEKPRLKKVERVKKSE